MAIPADRPVTRLRVPVVLAFLLLGLAASTISACSAERDDTAARAPLYLAIGASESVGTGARNPSTEGWVPQLHAMMPDGTRLVNLGIGGLTVRQAIEQVLPVAVDLKPDIITVWLAVNDFGNNVPLEDYRTDLNTLLETLARETQARVYVGNLPDLTLLPTFRGYPQDRLTTSVAAWNEVIAQTIAAHGATLVDLYSGYQELKVHPEYISRDGLHPSTAGHRRIAQQFWGAVSEER